MASLLQNEQALLQSRAALRYYKVGQEMLQGGANVTKNWGRFYKVERGRGGGGELSESEANNLLQSGTIVITNWAMY